MVESSASENTSLNSPQVKEVISKLDDVAITQENVANFYNEVGADGYDEWAKAVNFNEPEHIVNLIAANSEINVSPECEVLDAGAGSGVIGKLLKERAFTNITGVDPSEAMLEKLN